MLQSDVIDKVRALGTVAGTSVHHEVVPTDIELPFIASTEIFANQPVTLDGRKLLATAQIRLGLFAVKGTDIESMKAAIRIAFNGFRGQMGATHVEAARVESSTDQVVFQSGDRTIKGSAVDLFFKFNQE